MDTTNLTTRIGMAAGVGTVVLGTLKDVVPQQYQPQVVLIGAILAALSGLFHPQVTPKA